MAMPVSQGKKNNRNKSQSPGPQAFALCPYFLPLSPAGRPTRRQKAHWGQVLMPDEGLMCHPFQAGSVWISQGWEPGKGTFVSLASNLSLMSTWGFSHHS